MCTGSNANGSINSWAIPVLHAAPGCSTKLNDNSGSSGHYGPNVYPCSLVTEKEVVFGGIKKLRNTIENSLKVIIDYI